MRIDIWSDVVCPWCYIGKRNLDAALAGFAHRADVEVHWHAFELDPDAPRVRDGAYVDRLARKYRTTHAEATAMVERMTRAGAEAGITMDFERMRPGNSFDAHRLLAMAGAEYGPQTQSALKERLFRALFTDGETTGEPDTLIRLATEVGLDEVEVRRVLAGDLYAAEVRAEERTAAELDVTAVPFFVFERTYAVPGAQPPDSFRRVLERVWSRGIGDGADGGDGPPAPPSS